KAAACNGNSDAGQHGVGHEFAAIHRHTPAATLRRSHLAVKIFNDRHNNEYALRAAWRLALIIPRRPTMFHLHIRRAALALALVLFCVTGAAAQSEPRPGRWTEQAANEWYARQPWLVGSNYIPATAINEPEMWQADSFDPARIDKELGWAESLGLNTMRVFLHDLLWQQDDAGFKRRIDTFLRVAARHHIKPLF